MDHLAGRSSPTGGPHNAAAAARVSAVRDRPLEEALSRLPPAAGLKAAPGGTGAWVCPGGAGLLADTLLLLAAGDAIGVVVACCACSLLGHRQVPRCVPSAVPRTRIRPPSELGLLPPCGPDDGDSVLALAQPWPPRPSPSTEAWIAACGDGGPVLMGELPTLPASRSSCPAALTLRSPAELGARALKTRLVLRTPVLVAAAAAAGVGTARERPLVDHLAVRSPPTAGPLAAVPAACASADRDRPLEEAISPRLPPTAGLNALPGGAGL